MADFHQDVGLRARKLVGEGLYKQMYALNGPLDPLVPREQIKRPKKPESPYTINNVLWFIASIAVFYYTDFALAVMYDPRVHRVWLKIALGLISINITIGAFLIIFLSWIKKVPSDQWEMKFPAAIPFATACFILGAFCLMVALWPIWHIFTPLILFILFMGIVVVIAVIPSF